MYDIKDSMENFKIKYGFYREYNYRNTKKGCDNMSDWIDEMIIEPMNKWAEKHPWFPLQISIIALIISILLPIVRLSLS